MAFYFWAETQKTGEKQRALALLPVSGSDLWNAAGAAENSSAGHVAMRGLFCLLFKEVFVSL